jgi:hypothetical protein
MTSHTEAAGSESNRLRSDWWSGSLHRVRRTSPEWPIHSQKFRR